MTLIISTSTYWSFSSRTCVCVLQSTVLHLQPDACFFSVQPQSPHFWSLLLACEYWVWRPSSWNLPVSTHHNSTTAESYLFGNSFIKHNTISRSSGEETGKVKHSSSNFHIENMAENEIIIKKNTVYYPYSSLTKLNDRQQQKKDLQLYVSLFLHSSLHWAMHTHTPLCMT